MAKLVSAKCPNCGGNVRIDPNLDHVTCQFCATSAFIEGRSRAPLPPDQPVFRVQQQTGASWTAFAIPLGLVLIMGIVGLVSFMARGGPGAINRGIRLVSGWSQPMVGDANGDEVQDLVTWLHVVRGGTTYLAIAAYDGRNGKELWTSDELGDATSQHNMAVAVMNRRLLLADADGKLHGHDLATGKRLWTQPLGERVEHFCHHGTHVEVSTKDDKQRWLDSATGKPVDPPAASKVLAPTKDDGAASQPVARWCERPSTDAKGIPAGIARFSWHDQELRDNPVPDIEDFAASTVLRRKTGPRLVLGNRKTGTRIPMVAAIDGSKVLWSLNVPASDPLSVAEGAPEIATIAAGRAFVVYGKSGRKGYRLTAISLKSGKRLWDVALPIADGDWPYTIATSKRYVFVGDRKAVIAVRISKGTLKYTVR